jgi:hypothetical protein
VQQQREPESNSSRERNSKGDVDKRIAERTGEEGVGRKEPFVML